MKQQILGKLIGNTGDPHNLTIILSSSFAGRRGEFVRIRHQEKQQEPETDVLGRITNINRSNILYNSQMGQSITDLELLPGAKITGEKVIARLELIGFKNPKTGQIEIPRRALDPGAKFELDDLSEILPGLTEPQQRILDVAIRYWRTTEKSKPRDINRLRYYLGDGLDELREWSELSSAEATALNNRSAAVASMKLSRVLNEAQSFYSAALARPTDIYEVVGRLSDKRRRLVIVDLQGLSDTAKQVITALISSEILRAAASKTDRIRPCFLVYEE